MLPRGVPKLVLRERGSGEGVGGKGSATDYLLMLPSAEPVGRGDSGDLGPQGKEARKKKLKEWPPLLLLSVKQKRSLSKHQLAGRSRSPTCLGIES